MTSGAGSDRVGSASVERMEGSPAGRGFWLFNAALSAGALAFLAYVLLLRRSAGVRVDVSFLPAVNAFLNATAACLLIAGWVAVRRGARRLHPYLMVSGFAASALFFVSYSVYHWIHGDTKFLGHGVIRTVYLSILASHVLLSMAVVPLSLAALWFAARRSFPRHRRVARVLLPMWLYVSVTGVAIFFLLRAHS